MGEKNNIFNNPNSFSQHSLSKKKVLIYQCFLQSDMTHRAM